MNDATPLPPPDYEASDASPKIVALTALGVALGIGLSLLASAWLYRAHYRDVPTAGRRGPTALFQQGPHASTAIDRDWAAQDPLVEEHLHMYHWVDREAGVVRIPIDRAMIRLVEEAATPPSKEAR